MKTGLFVSVVCLIAAGDAIPPEMLDPVARMGPTAVLGLVLMWIVTKTLPGKDKQFAEAVKEIAERQHTDSAKLNDTLNALTANCAAMQAARNKGD